MAGPLAQLFWTDEELEALWSAPADTPLSASHIALPVERRHVAATDVAAITYEPPRWPRSDCRTGGAGSEELSPRWSMSTKGSSGTSTPWPGTATTGRDAPGGRRRRRGRWRGRAPGGRREGGPDGGGEEWSERAGGTSGALWSAALMALASSLRGPALMARLTWCTAVTRGREAMVGLGQAGPGDKTVVDALSPFVEALTRRSLRATGWRPHSHCG